jgi:hypothetical protein
MKTTSLTVALILAASLITAPAARAETCVKKAAEATSGTEDSAKWFALETMVQAVSWGLWPSFVATGDVPGYKITSQKYKCDKSGMGVTCRGWATFCKKPS